MDVNSIHHETEINHLTSPLELVKLSKVGMKESEVRIKINLVFVRFLFTSMKHIKYGYLIKGPRYLVMGLWVISINEAILAPTIPKF